ncbi:hypothetical protein NA57DRAFT_72670 [Rhizodiscina lignyota]|uniref:Transcription factor domain-containing protein n=1 Tax=Rhizodiscina lignyota TaxID=1504668 RepID=A0A9P4IL21_9PEZI|nr:hypothetical protein NA57DRAFT_72670 [Rhizodiscina lignyota]
MSCAAQMPQRARVRPNKDNALPIRPSSASQATRNGKQGPDAVDYEFFMSTGKPETVGGASRRTIRSHVMRNFFHQRVAAIEEQSHQSSASTVKAKQNLKGRFRLDKSGAAKKRTDKVGNGSPENAGAKVSSQSEQGSRFSDVADSGGDLDTGNISVSTGSMEANNLTSTPIIPRYMAQRIDPFDALPIKSGPRVETLIYYWQTVFKVNSVAINPTPGSWLSFAKYDPGILHSTLCSVAMYCGLYHGLNSNIDIHYHKGEALKLVNKKLQNPDERTSDALIAVITVLASFENLWGAYEVASSHVTGLRRLIALRGGLPAIKHNDPLQRAVAWSEYHLAAAWRIRPSFEFVPQPYHATLPDELLVEAALSSPNCLLKLTIDRHEMFNVYYSLHQVAIAYNTPWADRMDRMLMSNMLHEIDYKLLCQSSRLADQNLEAKFPSGNAVSVIEALTVAAQMFLYGALRSIPLPIKVFDLFLSRLVAALDIQDLLGAWETQCTANALLWVFFVGSIVAQGRQEMPWFIDNTLDFMRKTGISTKKEYEQALKGFAWTDDFCASPCESLWKATAERGASLKNNSVQQPTDIPLDTSNAQAPSAAIGDQEIDMDMLLELSDLDGEDDDADADSDFEDSPW